MFIILFYLRALYVVTSRQSTIKYLQMTLLYTKHAAENSAVWTVYVKYGLKGLEIWVWKSVDFWNVKCVETLQANVTCNRSSI